MSRERFYWCSGPCHIVGHEALDDGDARVTYKPAGVDSKFTPSAYCKGELVKQLERCRGSGRAVAIGGHAMVLKDDENKPPEEAKHRHYALWLDESANLPKWVPAKDHQPVTDDGRPVVTMSRDETVQRQSALKSAVALYAGHPESGPSAVLATADRFLAWLNRTPVPAEAPRGPRANQPSQAEPDRTSAPKADLKATIMGRLGEIKDGWDFDALTDEIKAHKESGRLSEQDLLSIKEQLVKVRATIFGPDGSSSGKILRGHENVREWETIQQLIDKHGHFVQDLAKTANVSDLGKATAEEIRDIIGKVKTWEGAQALGARKSA